MYGVRESMPEESTVTQFYGGILMEKVKIDWEKCIGCGACANDCVSGCLKIVNGKAEANTKSCIGCGHCYAVCPQNAITMPELEPDMGELVSMSEFDSERLLQAMKSRRSIRRFLNQPVEEDKLNMILEAGRYCPTGTNSQDVAYTILGSKQSEIEGICVDLFRKGAGMAEKVTDALKNVQVDDHFFFKGAPLVIVVSAKNRGNANLASSYMELMAESLGLGVLYSGFFVACTMLSGKLRKLLDLPHGHKVVTCLVIGYPAVKYYRIPGRKKATVRKL